MSGSASDTVAEQKLLFTDETGETVETEIAADGTYSVSLPIGHTYTVSFANADIYAVTDGGTIDLTDASDGQEMPGHNITYRVIWDTSKEFSFQIAGTTYTVMPGSSSSEDFSVTTDGGDGSVELATTDTAIIWADLNSAGVGSIQNDTIKNVSENVTYEVSGNTITFTYNDTETSPTSYTIQVKDNSASGTPHADGRTKTYDFGDGSIVSELYRDNYSICDGKSVSSTDGLVTVTGNNGISYNGSHGIMMGSGDQVSVKVAGDAEIALELCAYTAEDGKITVDVSEEENGDTGAGETEGTGAGTVSPSSVDAKAATDGDKATFTYTGGPATLTFTYTESGSGYLHSMDVTNQLPEPEITKQEEMPAIKDFGNQTDMTVIPVGQQLTLEQEGGSMATGEALSDTVSYYGFDATADCNKLEADITLTAGGNSSSSGVFFGVFNGEAIETVGIRNHTNLRAVYSDETDEVNAGRIDETIEEGQTVHFTAEKKSEDGEVTFVITATPQGGETYTSESSESNLLFDGDMENAEISFGFILADAVATVTNMKYYAADGTVLYDQNNCYAAIGEAPVVTSVQASVADTRDAIIVSWNSEELPYGDARFVVEMCKESQDEDVGDGWTTVAETTESSYMYPATEPGTYEFRVGGKVGSDGEVTYCEQTATVKDYLPALPTPVVTLEAHESSIDVSWTRSEGATDYEIYRYSSDEGPGQAKVVYTTSDTADAPYGLIFDHCRITSEEGCVDGTFRLARPWGPDGCIYWLNCYMGSALDKEEPYADMSGNAYLEARFFECGSYGPGYAVNATRRQISPTGAENLLAGLGWTPEQTSEAVGAAYIGNVVTPEPGEPIPEEPSTEEPPSETPSADDTTEGPSSGTSDGDDAAKNPSSGTSAADTTTARNGDGANGQSVVPADSVSKLEPGMLVVDNQYNAVFEVCGSASEGFTLTCVRPASRNTSRVKIPAKVKVGKEEYPVTAIAAGAFKGKKELRKVIIGANVTRIGKKAFQGCQSLKKLVIKSKKLKKIGAKAFRNSNPALKIKVPGGRKKAYRKLFKKVGVRL